MRHPRIVLVVHDPQVVVVNARAYPASGFPYGLSDAQRFLLLKAPAVNGLVAAAKQQGAPLATRRSAEPKFLMKDPDALGFAGGRKHERNPHIRQFPDLLSCAGRYPKIGIEERTVHIAEYNTVIIHFAIP